MSLRFCSPIVAALVAAAFAALTMAQPAAAADCGSEGHPPCEPNRPLKPKPVATKPVSAKSATQKPSSPQRDAEPQPDDAPPRGATSSRRGQRASEPEREILGPAVDISLTKVPDIIAPEPRGDAQPDEAVGGRDAEIEAEPLPPPGSAQPRRKADPKLVRAAREDLARFRHSEIPKSEYRTVLLNKYPPEVVKAVLP